MSQKNKRVNGKPSRKALITAGAILYGMSAAATTEPLERGKLLFEQRCGTCHKLPDPQQKPWTEWLNIMVAMGHMADLNDTERALILQYLLAHDIAAVTTGERPILLLSEK